MARYEGKKVKRGGKGREKVKRGGKGREKWGAES